MRSTFRIPTFGTLTLYAFSFYSPTICTLHFTPQHFVLLRFAPPIMRPIPYISYYASLILSSQILRSLTLFSALCANTFYAAAFCAPTFYTTILCISTSCVLIICAPHYASKNVAPRIMHPTFCSPTVCAKHFAPRNFTPNNLHFIFCASMLCTSKVCAPHFAPHSLSLNLCIFAPHTLRFHFSMRCIKH